MKNRLLNKSPMRQNEILGRGENDGVIRMADDAREVYLDSLYDPNLPSLLMSTALGETAAIVVDDAVPSKVSNAIERAVKQQKLNPYAVEKAFLKSGIPLFEAAAQDRMQEYYSSVRTILSDLQRSIAPYITPEAMLRMILDQAWPGGAKLMRLNGQPCPFGLLRMVSNGGSVAPHCDNSDLDHPDRKFKRAITNLSWVSYHSSCLGGEIEIWPVGFTTSEALDRNRVPGHPYALAANQLPTPRVKIAPRRGRMIFFNAKFVHKVASVSKESNPRITQSGFVLVTSFQHPLDLYQ